MLSARGGGQVLAQNLAALGLLWRDQAEGLAGTHGGRRCMAVLFRIIEVLVVQAMGMPASAARPGAHKSGQPSDATRTDVYKEMRSAPATHTHTHTHTHRQTATPC